VTITLTNNATATGLPAMVTSRSDAHTYPVKVGNDPLQVSCFAA
jgi:hypothetical protein